MRFLMVLTLILFQWCVVASTGSRGPWCNKGVCSIFSLAFYYANNIHRYPPEQGPFSELTEKYCQNKYVICPVFESRDQKFFEINLDYVKRKMDEISNAFIQMNLGNIVQCDYNPYQYQFEIVGSAVFLQENLCIDPMEKIQKRIYCILCAICCAISRKLIKKLTNIN